MRRLALGALAASLVLSACGGSHEDHDPGATEGESTTTVEVSALDSLAFEPGALQVEAGEVVTFVVSNPGKSPHEFVLGDEQYQEEHARMMEDGHGMEHDDNALELAPGETAELTWEFEDAGEVLFACHVAGHYDGGMVGTIRVT